MRSASTLAIGVTAVAAVLVASAGTAHAEEVRFGHRPGVYLLGDGPTHVLGANDKLKYYGGRVISNVQVVAVFWTPQVRAETQQKIGGFYDVVTKSAHFDWLSEYDTIGKVGFVDGKPGSNQHIGRGTFAGAKTITPANTKKALTDAEVAAELVAQIQANVLPAPKLDAQGNVDTLYMIDFPTGYDIALDGMHACQQYGAYHFTTTLGGKSVPYGIHPDCNYGWDVVTAIHSHELVEAVTDAEVGLVDQKAAAARPIAWVTLATTAFDSQEIADICQTQPYAKVDGYTVAKEWSNFAQACVVSIPVCDGVLVPPACRPCNGYDSGNACTGATPACANSGPKVGQCVACTTAYSKACTGATPLCDESKYTCVGCLASVDCPAATPVCDAKSCRTCRADGECAPGLVCDASDAGATAGRCVQCLTDAQCGARRCDLGTHTCIAGSTDAGTDGGGSAAADDSGCACGIGPRSSGDGALLLALVGVCAAAMRRRRR